MRSARELFSLGRQKIRHELFEETPERTKFQDPSLIYLLRVTLRGIVAGF